MATSSRACVLLCTLVAVAALTSYVVAEPRGAFQVGTREGLADVVVNGTVVSPWNEAHKASVGANPTLALFHFYAMITTPTGSDEITLVANTNPSYTVSLPSPTITVIAGRPPTPIPIKFVCITNNTAAPETTAIDIRFQSLANTVTILFDKVCTWPFLNIGQTELVGNIYHLGKAMPWDGRWGIDDVEARFYLWLDNTNPYAEVGFDIEITYDKTILSIQTHIGEPVARKIQLGTPEASIFLRFTCLNPTAESQASVHIRVTIGWTVEPSRDIQFSFLKQCSSSHVVNPRRGFNIGTLPGGSDVARDGALVDGWDFGDKIFGYGAHEVLLYASLNMTATDMNPRFQEFNVTVQTEGAYPNVEYVIIGQNLTGVVKANQDSIPIHIRFWCRFDGDANTRVYVHLPGSDTFSFYFDKVCVWPLLQVGLADNTNDVVSDTKVVGKSWTDTGSVTTFYLWLPAKQAVSAQPYTIRAYNYDHNIMSVGIMQPGDSTARPLNFIGAPEAIISFNYQCYDSAVGKIGGMSLELDFGWTETILITWSHQCGTPKPTPPTPGGGGWSAFGIFSFTVFMFGLVGCVGGCIFNYFAQGKRGTEVVPGNSYMRQCYDKLTSKKPYSPQTDYQYDAAEEKTGGGGGYQNDL